MRLIAPKLIFHGYSDGSNSETCFNGGGDQEKGGGREGGRQGEVTSEGVKRGIKGGQEREGREGKGE